MSNTFFEWSTLPLDVLDQDFDVPQCGECGLFTKCTTPKMPVYGKGRKKIMIVSETPGEAEDNSGHMVHSKATKYLEDTLRTVGIVLKEDCWLTYSLICRPENNYVKHKKWVDYCRPNFIDAFNDLQPNVVIPMGGVACSTVLTHARSIREGEEILKWTGWHIPSQKMNAWICPTYSPSYIDREMEQRKTILPMQFKEHLRRASLHTIKPWREIPDYTKEVEILYEPDEVIKVISYYLHASARKKVVAAFDYETNMLKPDAPNSRLYAASICFDGEQTISFLWSEKLRDVWIEFLTNPRIVKIASNAYFEHRWSLAMFDVSVRGWDHDTMTTAHALDHRSGITSIKFQAFVLLGIEEYDSHIHPYLVGTGSYGENTIHKADPHQVLLYCGMDSLLEFKVAENQKRKVGLVN